MSCELEVVIWEVGVGVGWCDLREWNIKLKLEFELELQSLSCGDCSKNLRWDWKLASFERLWMGENFGDFLLWVIINRVIKH